MPTSASSIKRNRSRDFRPPCLCYTFTDRDGVIQCGSGRTRGLTRRMVLPLRRCKHPQQSPGAGEESGSLRARIQCRELFMLVRRHCLCKSRPCRTPRGVMALTWKSRRRDDAVPTCPIQFEPNRTTQQGSIAGTTGYDVARGHLDRRCCGREEPAIIVGLPHLRCGLEETQASAANGPLVPFVETRRLSWSRADTPTYRSVLRVSWVIVMQRHHTTLLGVAAVARKGSRWFGFVTGRCKVPSPASRSF